MRPLIHYRIGTYIYLGCDSFSVDFGQFGRFFQNANGHTDGRTHPLKEMRRRISKVD